MVARSETANVSDGKRTLIHQPHTHTQHLNCILLFGMMFFTKLINVVGKVMVIYARSSLRKRIEWWCVWTRLGVCVRWHIENIAFGRNNKIELCHAKHKQCGGVTDESAGGWVSVWWRWRWQWWWLRITVAQPDFGLFCYYISRLHTVLIWPQKPVNWL